MFDFCLDALCLSVCLFMETHMCVICVCLGICVPVCACVCVCVCVCMCELIYIQGHACTLVRAQRAPAEHSIPFTKNMPLPLRVTPSRLISESSTKP
jgi:hypothetical protein